MSVIEKAILKLENQEKELRVKINSLQKELEENENKKGQEKAIFIENELRKLYREKNKVNESIARLKHELSILNILVDKKKENTIKTIKINKDIDI